MPSGADVLIIHASRHGHSGRVAEYIAEQLRAAGCTTELADVRHQPDVDAHGRAAIVAIGSIHMDRHAEELLSWLERWRPALATTPHAVLTTSLKAVSELPEQQAAVAGYVDALRLAAGATAEIAEPLAGALQYRDYSWLTRRMLRRIAADAGLSTDTSRNHDYCDWRQVDRIAQEVAALAGRTPSPLAAGGTARAS